MTGRQHHHQKLVPPPVHLESTEHFTFDVYALDAIDLGLRFRLKSWGWTEHRRCNHVALCYVAPTHASPNSATEIRELDLAASNTIPDVRLSDEGRQEAFLRRHQELYAKTERELWFHHVQMRPLMLDVQGGITAVLDIWRGRKREYHLLRAFIGDVELQLLTSGVDVGQMQATIDSLVVLKSKPLLARWHDDEHRAYMNNRPAAGDS